MEFIRITYSYELKKVQESNSCSVHESVCLSVSLVGSGSLKK